MDNEIKNIDTKLVKETHLRTIVKSIIYRLLSTICVVGITILIGADNATAGIMGLGVLVLGTLAYYIHDRLWIKSSWGRSNGFDDNKRSIIKAIIYRIIVFAIAFVFAKIFLLENSSALLWTISQALINVTLFYIIERIFNLISWGKHVVATEEETSDA